MIKLQKAVEAIYKVAKQSSKHAPQLRTVLREAGRLHATNLSVFATLNDTEGDDACIDVITKAVLPNAEIPAKDYFPPQMFEHSRFCLEHKPVACIKREELAWLAKAMSVDEQRYILNGVYLDGKNDKMVATDGRRLHMLNVQACNLNCVIPDALIHAALAAMSKEETANIYIEEMPQFIQQEEGESVRETWVAFEISVEGGRKLFFYAKAIEGTYPAYQQVCAYSKLSQEGHSVNMESVDALCSTLTSWLKGQDKQLQVEVEPIQNALKMRATLVGATQALAQVETLQKTQFSCRGGFFARYRIIHFIDALSMPVKQEVKATWERRVPEECPLRVTSGDAFAILMPCKA